MLRRKFRETVALSSPVRDGRAWLGGRTPIPLNLNLRISTMPPEGLQAVPCRRLRQRFRPERRRITPAESSAKSDGIYPSRLNNEANLAIYGRATTKLRALARQPVGLVVLLKDLNLALT